MDEADKKTAFDMGALRTNLPKKRGLSRYYSGKARSFACLSDAQCVEDLKKQQHHEAKKRKKQSDRESLQVPPFPCRRVSSSTQCASPIVGM